MRSDFKRGYDVHLPIPTQDWVWVSFRYDRVILDTDSNSMAFRVYSPRIGVTPFEGVDIFVQYSAYDHGRNVFLRPNQIPGDPSVRQPDDGVLKLQAQANW